MLVLLVDVHRAAEDDHRVVAERIGRRLAALGEQPLVELWPRAAIASAKTPGAGVGLLDYREDAHYRCR